MVSLHRVLLAGVVAASLAAPALADVHRDDDYGYLLNVPQGWKRIPLQADESYVLAKYLCDRAYSSRDGQSHTPDVKVIFFPVGGKTRAEGSVSDQGDVNVRQTYKNFKDYLKDNSYGGFFLSKEEETTVAGIPATWMEIKYEKLTTPRHGLAVAFHRDLGDYVVQFEVLEDQWEKLGKDYAACVRTFKFLPPKKDLKAVAEGARPGEVKPGQDGKEPPKIDDSPEGRKRRRDASFQKELETARAGLTAGWKEMKSKNFIAITHVDDKYTKRVLEQAEAVRAWVEKAFADVGSGQAGQVIIRICESEQEENSFRDATAGTGWFKRGVSITTYKDLTEGRQSMAIQWVNTGVVDHWLADRDPGLMSAMPGWLRYGLRQFTMTATVKGGQINFKPDQWEVDKLRESSRNGKVVGAKDLLTSTWETFAGVENAMAQAGAFVRYFLDGPGTTAPKTRGRLIEYMKNLSKFVREREEEAKRKEGGGDEPEAKTEEEEEERARKRQEEWKAKEKELLDEVQRRTFPGMADADWTGLDRSWRKYVE